MKKLTFLLIMLLLALPALPALAEVPCSYYSAHGDHDWIQTDVSLPTCTDYGYVYLECQVCHTQDTLVNPPYGHSWEDIANAPPTCTSSGWRMQECTECYATRNLEIPKLEHKWVQVGNDTPSTCAQKGSRTEQCMNCGQFRTIELPLIDHVFGPWFVLEPATDHSAGTRARTCSVCGQEETHFYYMDGTLYRGGPSGQAVADMQQKLIDLHYLNDRADGSFGKKTEQAVKDFQQASGLEVTGVGFPQTLEALLAAWEQAMGIATGPKVPVGGAPCCIRTPGPESTEVSFCAVHGALYEKELELRMKAANEDEAIAALRDSVSLWLEDLDGLYTQWEARLGEADKSLALEARNAFAAMFRAQETALTAVYGADSRELLTIELGLLHEQATTLCGILNLDAE